MGKKWKRILRLRRNAGAAAVEEAPGETPVAAVATPATKPVKEAIEEADAPVLKGASKGSAKTATSAKSTKTAKSSKTSKRGTKNK